MVQIRGLYRFEDSTGFELVHSGIVQVSSWYAQQGKCSTVAAGNRPTVEAQPQPQGTSKPYQGTFQRNSKEPLSPPSLTLSQYQSC